MCLLGRLALTSQGYIFLYLPIKLSYNIGPSVTSNFCCSRMEARKLYTPLTHMVLFLRFNLAETTSAWPLQSGGQAQQKPDSVKLPWQKLNAKKSQHSGRDQKPSMLETRTAKTNSAESSCGSVSDCRRPPVQVGIPHSYGWKDIMANKILNPLQSLISCFLEPPANRPMAVGAIEGLWRGYFPVYPEGSIILCSSSVLNLLCAEDQANENCEHRSGIFSRFSSRL